MLLTPISELGTAISRAYHVEFHSHKKPLEVGLTVGIIDQLAARRSYAFISTTRMDNARNATAMGPEGQWIIELASFQELDLPKWSH